MALFHLHYSTQESMLLFLNTVSACSPLSLGLGSKYTTTSKPSIVCLRHIQNSVTAVSHSGAMMAPPTLKKYYELVLSTTIESCRVVLSCLVKKPQYLDVSAMELISPSA